jgi:hypothetical protein
MPRRQSPSLLPREHGAYAQASFPLITALALGLAVALAVVVGSPRIAAVAVIPTALVSLVFGLVGIHPRNLRRLGWSLVASNVAVFAALIVGLK